MQDMYDRFNTFEALNLRGRRNIVHPKQYFTIRGFSYIVKEYFDMFSRKGGQIYPRLHRHGHNGKHPFPVPLNF